MSGNSQDDPKAQQQNLQLRVALNDAYAAIQAAKATQSFTALTFEDLAQDQINRLSGPDTPSRPNVLNRIQAISTNLQQAVAQIKALPPEYFATSNSDRDVNTPA